MSSAQQSTAIVPYTYGLLERWHQHLPATLWAPPSLRPPRPSPAPWLGSVPSLPRPPRPRPRQRHRRPYWAIVCRHV
eukprot:COSAG06_NODE_1466_length_9367_cov_6.526651_4_plen_77_part_00